MFMMCLLLIGASARAWDVINVDFVYGGSATSNETGQGALGTGTGWVWAYLGSEQTQSTPVTVTDVVDYQGNPTTVDVIYDALSRGAYAADSVQSSTLPATNGHDMMVGYLTTQNATNSVRIQGLAPGANYTLYLFGHGDNEAQNTQFTVNGVTKGSTIDVTGLTQLTEDAHYVVFDFVTADVDGQIQIEYANGPDNAWGSFNGMQITPGLGANTPVPADGSIDVDSLTVNSISWSAPVDPNIVSVGYDVYFSDVDPNFIGELPVSSDQSGTTYNTGTLAGDTTYYWRVDSRVIWDSNSITGNWTDVIPGFGWQFTTAALYAAPEITTMDSTITLLDLLPCNLSATVVENPGNVPAMPITSVAFTVLTDDWLYPAGATASVTNTTIDNNNPTATFTADMAGTYKVKLTVGDGISTVERIAEIRVFTDACEAKKSSPSGWDGDYFDENGDCVVDLTDFAQMGLQWLNSTAMIASETYPDPVYPYVSADVVVDTADAYVIKYPGGVYDPNLYVSEPPLDTSGGPRIITHEQALGGSVIGYTGDGDFIVYEVDVPTTGDYTVSVMNALRSDYSAAFTFTSFDDVTIYGTITASTGTGWGDSPDYDQFKLDSATMTFTAGVQLLKVTWTGQANIDFITLTKQ